jgi:hypothetical protein
VALIVAAAKKITVGRAAAHTAGTTRCQQNKLRPDHRRAGRLVSTQPSDEFLNETVDLILVVAAEASTKAG